MKRRPHKVRITVYVQDIDGVPSKQPRVVVNRERTLTDPSADEIARNAEEATKQAVNTYTSTNTWTVIQAAKEERDG